ncbi:phosphoribosylamine--glycine ligase [Desulfocarbo indianensis]|nr:phosphoribosylamine--glycine ligase [Desulfocarbo indianensis]
MKVLVVGGGGREHALVWKLAQSPKVTELYCAPGNPGMQEAAQLVDIGAEDIPQLLSFAKEKKIDLTVVGPEAPLVAGIADAFEAAGLLVAGPSAYAAQLEGSKAFAKEMMYWNRVPTAEYKVFDDPEEAKKYAREAGRKLVVKADGLAAGKGVLLCKDAAEAEAAIDQVMVAKAYGAAGDKAVIEDWLEGEEASFLVFTDGKTIVAMPSSQDHKAIGEGDAGLNTGGMGAYSPAPVVSKKVQEMAQWWICQPIIEALAKKGHPFKGILYAGLMINEKGDPSVLEFNVRFGDPECQPLLMRLESDLFDILYKLAQGKLHEAEVKWSDDPTVCVVLASQGYPESYEKGKPISGLEEAAKVPGVVVFHAGTAAQDGRIVTAGGRVLGVTAKGHSIGEAVDRAYEAAALISWDGKYLRRDIAHRAMGRRAREYPGIYKGGAMLHKTEPAVQTGPVAGAPRKVGIVMGSASDWEVMKKACDTLDSLAVPFEVRVLSAHRTPAEAMEFARTAPDQGIGVIIAGAGWAAHLAGAMAAHCILPVIGVPIDSSPLKGMDALLSTVQMPPGIPVATVSIGSGGAKNAAILAAQILALADPDLKGRLAASRKQMANEVRKADRNLPR